MRVARRLFLLPCALGLSCSSEPNEEPSASTAEPITVCAGSSVVTGVDVSDGQGTVDWATVKASGRVFAYAQVSTGTTVDTTFEANWAGMKAAGLLRGAYQLFDATVDPTTQANMVIQKVGTLGKGDLPVVLNLGSTGGQAVATFVAHAKTWIAAIETGTGRKPIIEINAGFWSADVDTSDLSSYGLFIQSWGGSCPNLPSQWSQWVFWQYDDTQVVDGITAKVDTDEFNGSLADLEALAPAPPSDAGATEAGDAATADASPANDGAGPPADASSPPPDAAQSADGVPRPGPGLWCATSAAPHGERVGLAGLPLVALGLFLARRRAARRDASARGSTHPSAAPNVISSSEIPANLRGRTVTASCPRAASTFAVISGPDGGALPKRSMRAMRATSSAARGSVPCGMADATCCTARAKRPTKS